jgi:molecular chaperone GrpE
MPKAKTNPKNNLADQKIKDLEDRLKRSLADYSNLEKRVESQRQLFVTLATTAIVTKMIEVLDDFHLTYKHLSDPGLKMSIDKFVNVLNSEGVEEIKALDQKFNPETMECIEVVKGKNDQVISVKKIGYKLNGHLIRPAQVSVGKTETKN